MRDEGQRLFAAILVALVARVVALPVLIDWLSSSRPKLVLDVEVVSHEASDPLRGCVYFDRGGGFSETDRSCFSYTSLVRPRSYSVPLPSEPIAAIRFDPLELPGEVVLSRVSLADPASWRLDLDRIGETSGTLESKRTEGGLRLRATGRDPWVVLARGVVLPPAAERRSFPVVVSFALLVGLALSAFVAWRFHGVVTQQLIHRWPAVFVAAVFAGLALRLFRLISLYAVNVFFGDQWDFNRATLFETHSLWEMFRWQHGPPRLGLGQILSYLIEPLFRWNTRTESFAIGSLVLVTTSSATWLKTRVAGPLTPWDVCIPLIFLTPLQYATIFVVANWAHGPLPVLLIVLYCLCWTISSVSWRYSLVLIINFVIIHTGLGLFLGAVTPFVLAADYWGNVGQTPRGRLYVGGALALSLASLASFFVGYVYDPAVECRLDLLAAPWSYPQFVLLMFANLVGARGLGGLQAVAGAIVVGCLFAALAINCREMIARRPHRAPYFVAAVLIVFPLSFAAASAYGRSCLGPEEAQVSRYVMYLEPALLGLYLTLLALPRGTLRASALAVLTVVLVGTVPIRVEDRSTMEYYRQLKADWKACYLRYEDIAKCGEITGHWIYAPSKDELLKERLEFLKRTELNLYADVGNSD